MYLDSTGAVIDESNADRVGVYKVDVDASPELASRFGVRSIPTLVVFKAGQPVETLVGVVTRGQVSGVGECRRQPFSQPATNKAGSAGNQSAFAP